MVTICQTCGDRGFSEALIYCDKCQAFAIHRYCLYKLPETFEEHVVWFCADCEPNIAESSNLKQAPRAADFQSRLKRVSSDRKLEGENDIKKLRVKRESSPSLVPGSNEESRLIEAKAPPSNTCTHFGGSERSDRVNIDEGAESVNNRTSPVAINEHLNIIEHNILDPGSRDLDRVYTDEVTECVNTKTSLVDEKADSVNNRTSPVAINEHLKIIKHNVLDPGSRELYRVHTDEVTECVNTKTFLVGTGKQIPTGIYLPAQPILEPIWRGSFHLSDEKLIVGVISHLSSLACVKVFATAKCLPQSLRPELFPRCDVWPEGFKKEGPTEESIALYFFPNNERETKIFDRLVDKMIGQDLGMRAVVQDVELLVYTSKVLPLHFWRFQEKLYLWGVFRAKQASYLTNAVRGEEKNLVKALTRDSSSPVSPLSYRDSDKEIDGKGGQYPTERAFSMEGQPSGIIEKHLIVRERSEKSQQRDGDCLKVGYVSTLPERVELDLRQNDLQDLKGIWDQWGTSDREAFTNKYGNIALLIQVNIDEQLLQAIAQFWNPGYRCFTFNREDMVPTIEEYSALLRIKHASPDRIYIKQRKAQSFRKKLAKITGADREWISEHIVKKGKSECIPWATLRPLIQGHSDREKARDIFALAVYGLVIFPRTLGCIEAAVGDIFNRLVTNINPSPAIVAETIRSLNICRKEGKGRFFGCAQLLHVWIHSHFWKEQKTTFCPSSESFVPIGEFLKKEWPKDVTKDQWVARFRSLRKDDVTWKAPWMLPHPILYKCGGNGCVPLLGIWGSISYAPLLVQRQYGSQQFTPPTHGLDQLDFAYEGEGYLNKVRGVGEAWKQTFRMELAICQDNMTPAYEEWRIRRVNDKLILPDDGAWLLAYPQPNKSPSKLDLRR